MTWLRELPVTWLPEGWMAHSDSRLLDAYAVDLHEHEQRYGLLPWRGGSGRLRPLVDASGLTGRGGAGFPAWRKAAAVAGGRAPVVVANGAEGEPASAKDRTLMVLAPHLVLDGLQLAAEDVGAQRVYVYASGAAATAVRTAVAQRTRVGRDQFPVEVIESAERFLAGEESAVVAALNNRPAIPRDKARRVTEFGVGGLPTLVHNVETLAQLALVARNGAEWFRELGTIEEPGTFLATLSGAVARPGVFETPYGTTIGDLVTLAGGATERLSAVLVGGFHGAWIPGAAAVGLPMTRAALAPWGAAPGAGVLVALPESSCGVTRTGSILAYLAAESAGQCGPCRFGLPAMASTWDELVACSGDPALPARVRRLASLVEGRGACHHPDGTARMVRSALHVFSAEIVNHLRGYCTAPSRHGIPLDAMSR